MIIALKNESKLKRCKKEKKKGEKIFLEMQINRHAKMENLE